MRTFESPNFQQDPAMYESRHHPPISRRHFRRRFLLHVLAAGGLMALSLFIGMAGYHWYEGLAWLDAFLNASMLLGGMGPVETPKTDAGTLFAGLYALYSGVVFLVGVGVILAPVLHRMLHLFHWEEKQSD